jgi:hypothetical protein
MTKQEIIEALQKLPDDATYEDAIERLYFLQKLERRLGRADAGHTIPHEEAKKRIAKWLK